MRSWLHLAVLAAVVAGLSVWVYYKPDAQKSEPYALSRTKASDVQRIRLERLAPGAQASAPSNSGSTAAPDTPAVAIELERRSEVWHITAPFSARAETFQVERLLGILDARSTARFPAVDLDRYGLAQPLSRMTLDAQTFAFGAVNTATREQYVLTNGAVYAIALVQRIAIPRDPDALISRALFAPGEAPVRFELPGFTATLDDGAWKFTPVPQDVGPDERNGWADRWRQALAVRAARHDGRTPESTVKVELKDGRVLTLGVLQREPELVLLRADEGVQYYFLAETGRRLMAAPGLKKSDEVTR